VGLGFVVSKGILHGNAAIQICHTNAIMGALLLKMNQQVVRLLCFRIKILDGYTPIGSIWRLFFKHTMFDHFRNVLSIKQYAI
jgi:hypothetical protein